MESGLGKDSIKQKNVLNRLDMFESHDDKSRMGNDMRKCTEIAPYPSNRGYYIALKAETIKEYVFC